MMGKPICTNRFEEIGVAYVDQAKTFAKAKERFDKCCLRCCMRKEHQDCEGCPIRATILANADNQWYVMKAEDYVWVEMERASVED